MKKKTLIAAILFLILAVLAAIFYDEKKNFLNSRKVTYDTIPTLPEESQSAVGQEQSLQLGLENLPVDNSNTEEDLKKEDVIERKTISANIPAPVAVKESAVKIPEKKSDAPIKTVDVKSDNSSIVSRLVSWGFQKSTGREIDTIIVHTSYDASGSDPYDVDGVIAQWKYYEVAPHYLIARNGTIYQLVEDQNIAWHAGVSKMPDGRTNVNDFSIGVEMINTKDGKFTSDQYDALNHLIVILKKKYSIEYVLGHDDIAPGRKTDPWGMDWSKVNR